MKGGDEVVTITIWGTPEGFDEEWMERLETELREAMQGYTPHDEEIDVIFPADRRKQDGKKIRVEIRGPVSSRHNIGRLLPKVAGETVAQYFPASKVQCVVQREELTPSTYWESR